MIPLWWRRRPLVSGLKASAWRSSEALRFYRSIGPAAQARPCSDSTGQGTTKKPPMSSDFWADRDVRVEPANRPYARVVGGRDGAGFEPITVSPSGRHGRHHISQSRITTINLSHFRGTLCPWSGAYTGVRSYEFFLLSSTLSMVARRTECHHMTCSGCSCFKLAELA